MTQYLTPSLIATAVLSVLFLFLAAAVWCDSLHHRIPNRLVFAGALTGLMLNVVLPEGDGYASTLPGAIGFLYALAGAAAGFALMLPLYFLRALGAGDVKLVAMVGAFLGPNAMLSVVLATFIAGGVLILAVVLRKRTLGLLVTNLRIALASCFFKCVLGEIPKADPAVSSAGRMPYGMAVAAGTFIYIALKSGAWDVPWLLPVIEWQ